MSTATTFRIGGPADCLVDISSAEEIAGVFHFAKETGVPVTLIGNGSNLLILDGGIRGMVLRVSSYYKDAHVNGKQIIAQAGISLASLAQRACHAGLAGLAPLSGIPGTLGGAIFMNAGAYGSEIGQYVRSILTYNPEKGILESMDHDQLRFGYRSSSLQGINNIVLEVMLDLEDSDPDQIMTEMQQLTVQRREKQPLEYPSAGSTFKRPKGAFAAKLIDDCGLRGFSVGDAQVSEKHCGFVINRGNASAKDVLTLMDTIKKRVFAETGYLLEPEIRILGTDRKEGIES